MNHHNLSLSRNPQQRVGQEGSAIRIEDDRPHKRGRHSIEDPQSD